jgi:hypothetical protein
MSQSWMSSLLLKLDNWRVRLHFKHVEDILRSRDVSYLPPTLQQARKQQLDRLHSYAVHGAYPRNHERPVYSPCFIDRDGRECAVAHLVMSSGQVTFAHRIAEVANYAYVSQMTFPELDDWAAQSGLSKEELALIQPGYYFTLDGSLLSLAITIWAVGLTAFVTNAVQIARKRKGIAAPVIALIIAILSLLLALVCIDSFMRAYYVATNPDTLNDQASRALEPLAMGTAISLVIALVTGGLGMYRIREQYRL